jgi:DNA polymerase III alpha subunit
MSYAELQVTTHYSFLRGASSPEELFAAAAALGITALGIVDRNSLAGIVRAHEAAKATGVRLIVGCRLDLQCGTSLLVYPADRPAYARLCRLLTLGKGRAGKGNVILTARTSRGCCRCWLRSAFFGDTTGCLSHITSGGSATPTTVLVSPPTFMFR